LAGGAAGAAFILKPEWVSGAAASSKVRLGLIGCGGRGMWIADLFQQSGLYEWVAGADFFEDRVKGFGDKFGVPPVRCHTGLASHRRLLEDPVDAVVIDEDTLVLQDRTGAIVMEVSGLDRSTLKTLQAGLTPS